MVQTNLKSCIAMLFQYAGGKMILFTAKNTIKGSLNELIWTYTSLSPGVVANLQSHLESLCFRECK